MPVDTTKTGLIGLESYADRQFQQAQATQLAAIARKTNTESEIAERNIKLGEEAAAALADPSKKTSRGPSADKIASTSMAEPLRTIADIYIRGGAAEEGAKYAKQASDIERQEMQNEADVVEMQSKRLKQMVDGADIMGRWLGGARSQEEYDYGLEQVAKTMPEEAAQIREKLPNWDPDVANFITRKALSVKDQAELDLRTTEEGGRAKRAAASISNENQRIALQLARDNESKRHNLVVEKQAGANSKSQNAPSPAEIAEAKSVLVGRKLFQPSGKKGGITPELDEASVYIVNETNRILKSTPGIDRTTAMNRAVMTAEAEGKFETSINDEGDTVRKFQRLKGEGRSADRPLPLPPQAALRKGVFYQLPGGQVGVYDGEGGFDPI